MLDGKWTFDYLKELTVGKAVDLNGDGKLDENDSYPVSGTSDDAYFITGFGEKMITRTPDNGFKFEMTSESFVNKVEQLTRFLLGRCGGFADCVKNRKDAMKMFQEDRAMFNVTTMNNVITGYGDYAVLPRDEVGLRVFTPLPKYVEPIRRITSTISQPAGPAGVAVRRRPAATRSGIR